MTKSFEERIDERLAASVVSMYTEEQSINILFNISAEFVRQYADRREVACTRRPPNSIVLTVKYKEMHIKSMDCEAFEVSFYEIVNLFKPIALHENQSVLELYQMMSDFIDKNL